MNLESLLKFAVQQGASDIHLQAGSPPLLRIHGEMRGVESPALATPDIDRLRTLLSLDKVLPADTPVTTSVRDLADIGRFRVRLTRSDDHPAAILRVIPSTVPTIEALGLPPTVGEVGRAARGLSLVAGKSGSGLTTTLAAMVEQVNQNTPSHIVLIEAAPEHKITPTKAIVSRLRVGTDAPTYAAALEEAIGLDPDLIVVDELTDADTAKRFLHAADTGFAVLGAIRSNSALDAVHALGNLAGQAVLRNILDDLDAVVAQRLVPTREGKRQPVVEILRGTPLVRRYLMENRLNDVAGFMAGREGGMQTFDQHLVELYQAKIISGTEAMRNATNVESVGLSLRGVVR